MLNFSTCSNWLLVPLKLNDLFPGTIGQQVDSDSFFCFQAFGVSVEQCQCHSHGGWPPLLVVLTLGGLSCGYLCPVIMFLLPFGCGDGWCRQWKSWWRKPLVGIWGMMAVTGRQSQTWNHRAVSLSRHCTAVSRTSSQLILFICFLINMTELISIIWVLIISCMVSLTTQPGFISPVPLPAITCHTCLLYKDTFLHLY